ncbi:SDR family oxidoreductase [Curtobacterium sp. VKM Ac-2887]|uniref:SDR family oxidoreductase n=1 Tax=Curtobacterium sp. VKM Ac-2887 TaxID=2783819 RepID=UPI00188CD68E|nr:SDR family oxidoreductase [Curtobacterium sp. VKM Ac-2887]MBF4585674.1 SDR family oxidoreductase [Curtobacterium sp. VKM Ac-2887]
MKVFVTGGSGQTGPAIIRELVRSGHEVTGLARSDASATTLERLGAQIVRGSLVDLDILAAAASSADGVVHMAYGGDYADPEGMILRDVEAVTALGKALEGSDKPFIVTSGTLVLPNGALASEDTAPDRDGPAAARLAGEDACLAFVDKGVRAIVLRLAPTVHGPNDHGFIPMLIGTARDKQVSAYVGDGSNEWPAVHRDDAAVLYRLALEGAPAGSVLHAVAENVQFADIATTIGQGLDVPTARLTSEDAAAHYVSPFMALIYAADAPASSARTRQLLDWEPRHTDLLDDLAQGDYLR